MSDGQAAMGSTAMGLHGGAFRPPAIGTRGVVASAHPWASMAGLRCLMDGGNAVDAAVAVAGALGVVEPFMSGLGGGGGGMLIYEAKTRRVHALNYYGQAPRATDPGVWGRDQEAVHDDVRSAIVPGMVGGWLAALERFGTMGRAAVFRDAADYAERGWPVTEFAAFQQAVNTARLERFESTRRVLYPNGRAPRVGELVPQPALGRSYRELIEGGGEAFYRGGLGERFVRGVQAAGGWLTMEDLAEFEPEWQEPVSVEYRGRRVWTPPPGCLGLQFLEELKMVEGLDVVGLGHNSAEYLHTLIETVKLASADRARYAMDRKVDARLLLDAEYAAERRKAIDPARARPSEGERYLARKSGQVAAGDPLRYRRDHTTHFEVIDAERNVVSVTHSNGAAWGCGFIEGSTGIALNDFLYWHDLEPESPNFMRPGVKGEMVMAPCIVTTGDAEPVLGLGTPGSYGILQTTFQMLLNALDFGMNVQAAIEAPRFRGYEGVLVEVEGRVPAGALEGLRSRGHELSVLPDWSWKVGGGHGVAVDLESGLMSGGADPRRDGLAVGW